MKVKLNKNNYKTKTVTNVKGKLYFQRITDRYGKKGTISSNQGRLKVYNHPITGLWTSIYNS
tara:strand:+ start:87 stop:272 length:186 start_codon:yes stop_codon:yes gene_type:complete